MSEHLYNALEHTEYGKTLQDNVRWAHFKPEFITNKQWVGVLGDDACNYRHHEYMAELTEQYIDRHRGWGGTMTDHDAQLLIDTAYVHDFPEAIDGDVPDPDKVFDKKTFERERQSMIKVLGSVAVDFVAIDVAAKVLPVMQGRSIMSHHWRAIELVGYAETTKRAGEKLRELDELREELCLSHGQTAELGAVLEDMSTRVHTANLAKLEQFRFLPAINEYLGVQ